MLKRTITYEDFDGNSISEEFYFNLTKPELLELDAKYTPDLSGAFDKAVKEEDRQFLLEMFKELILLSYGVRSEDGKRFIKDPELTKEFTQTNAYAELYIEILSDLDVAADFFIGVAPSDIAVKMKEENIKEKVAKELKIPEPKDESNAEN